MNDKKFFRDRVILITGASSGIGRAAACTLAGLGARVALVSRNEAKLMSLKEEIEKTGGRALAVKGDVHSLEDMRKASEETMIKWGGIDILIANAGKYIQEASHEVPLQAFEEAMAVNFYGVLHAVRSVLPGMKKRGSGHIVIVNSLGAKKAIVGDGPYAASKAALERFGDALRQELRPYKIRVTSIFPARVDTPMIESIKVPGISSKMPPEKVVHAMIRGIRRNKAEVIVPPILFIISFLNNHFPRLADWAYRIFKLEGKKS
ncbi:SDR family oxidoreductase [bacterium]|nr:SDR family oxidoreductase [bacterium]